VARELAHIGYYDRFAAADSGPADTALFFKNLTGETVPEPLAAILKLAQAGRREVGLFSVEIGEVGIFFAVWFFFGFLRGSCNSGCRDEAGDDTTWGEESSANA